ncbi:YlbF family regulator [Halosegnis rubeus]|uniref:YlbF family regulator n=1 Tax=Halosegnis rubeus TaxID=2212850 RepID=A0A5N5U8U3_9EURY|nr:YlbF family regulator [Halosegnis rubeus]KAB7512818.1 YlbF family regulator [Halosegnis rubeus]KAB7512935.1 YlbF family regulator [Halosegnis rubeus]KAB7515045.1 YlbF family regulator [Halosegnis rubeus]
MSTEPTDADAEANADSGMATAARVTELASDLGSTIEELDSYQRFTEAKRAVENDEEAQQRIQEFEQLREEFMMARQSGDASNEDLRELQAAQEELNEMPVMAEYLEAQEQMETELQELNKMISAPLSVDFGEKAGGCCQD